MKYFFIATFLIFFACGCENSNSTSQPPPKGSLSNHEFDAQASILLAGKWINHDEYEASDKWSELHNTVDFDNDIEVQRWLDLQKQILINASMPVGIKRSAIQEFYLHLDHSYEYEAWFKRCKDTGFFKDLFINQNVDMIINAINKMKKVPNNSAQ